MLNAGVLELSTAVWVLHSVSHFNDSDEILYGVLHITTNDWWESTLKVIHFLALVDFYHQFVSTILTWPANRKCIKLWKDFHTQYAFCYIPIMQ